ncbi:MAG: YeeE/YedE thiosulfate transporter family protein, partial [Chryseolinea sp.]
FRRHIGDGGAIRQGKCGSPCAKKLNELLSTLKGFIIIILGGFMVGFGTRYARGCTSGHGIMGLSSLQWTSLVATASFFTGGILVSQFILPYLLSL